MDEPRTDGFVPQHSQSSLAHAPSATPVPRRRRVWPFVVLVVVVAAGIWVFRDGEQASAQGSRGRGGAAGGAAVPVVAVAAREGSIGVYVDGLGAVTPLSTVAVRSRVDGELMAVHFREGDLVRQGDLLAEIDPRPYQVQLTQAQGQMARDQALLENARTDLVRYQDLVKQNAAPEQQLVTQKALVAQYEGAVKTDEGAIASATLSLTYSRITSPLTGRIGLRLIDPGNIVHASDAGGLLVITEVQPISVIFSIPEDRLAPVVSRVRSGALLRVDAYDRDAHSKLASGRLSTIDNQIDQTTGTLRVRAVFDNAKSELFPNQFVNARLLVEEKQHVTLLPTAAVERNGQATYVWLVKADSTVTAQPIAIGVSEGSDTEVVSGLSPGAVVVMTGIDKLQEGMKVHVQMDGTPSRPPKGQ
jgi:membrane fusion protein, multidrug efflux system